MSATNTYTAKPRATLGGHATAKLRTAGQVPVTISRPGKASAHVSVDEAQARHLAANVVHLCKFTIGNESMIALKGEIVVDCLKDSIQHIDLVEVDEKSEITVDVAIVPDARNCPGVKAGGIIEQSLRKLRVRCKVSSIPDAIALDLGETQIMQTVYAKSLKMPAGSSMVTNAKTPVLSVVIPRGMKKADEAAAVAAAAGATPAAGAAPAGDAKAATGKGAAGKPGAAAPTPAKAADPKKK
jgi:large subunit ribosomal protein L25